MIAHAAMNMKLIVAASVVLWMTVPVTAQRVPWKPVSSLLKERTEVKLGALHVRLVQLGEWNWELRVSQNGREAHKVDGLTIPDRAIFGQFPLLSADRSQLIIHANTGGSSPYAVCWIYSADAEPKLIYSSEPYWGRGPCGDLEVADLDGDGVFEIRHIVATFRGSEGDCNACACSPCPEAIFRYDDRQKKYRPANWEFPDVLNARVDEHLRQWQEGERWETIKGKYDRGVWLNVAFEYLYAGRPDEAWVFLQRKFGAIRYQKERELALKNLQGERFYSEVLKAQATHKRR